MRHHAIRSIAPLLLAAAAPHTLRAQGITEVSRTPIADAAQLTFGYLCDDRFVIRNDGTRAVALEYGLEKGTEHIRLDLAARESVELESKAKAGLELWMEGKLIAIAKKDRRSCKDVRGNGTVTVNPLDVPEATPDRPPYWSAYGWYDPFYGPWYGYAGYYGPFVRPYVGAVIRVPVIVGGRGGGRRR